MATTSALPTITGVVVRGAGRGKKIGFPTANLQLIDPRMRPPTGIYAGWARLLPLNQTGIKTSQQSSATTQLPAAIHVGPVPTFNKAAPTIEVHLLNFPDQDLYGQTMSVEFVAKISEVKKFASVEDLTAAITRNCQQAQKILGIPIDT